MKLELRLHKLSTEVRLRVIEELRRALKEDEDVFFVYLHGSFLEGKAFRDVDVAVWLREGMDPLSYVLERGIEMERRVNLPIDIHVLNEAPVTFKYYVYSRGLSLVIKDRNLHDLEVTKTALMYFDLLLLRRLV